MKIAKSYIQTVVFNCPYCGNYFNAKCGSEFFTMNDIPSVFLCTCGRKSAVPTQFKKAKLNPRR